MNRLSGVANIFRSLSMPAAITDCYKSNVAGAIPAESVDVTGDRKKYEPGGVLIIGPDAQGKFLKSVLFQPK